MSQEGQLPSNIGRWGIGSIAPISAVRGSSVDEAEETITTFVEGSTFPNSEGETLKRVVTRITPDTLVYENPSTTRGERVEAVWRRLN